MNYGDSGGPGAKPWTNTALSTTVQAVKTSSGRLYGWHVYNPNSVDAFVLVYDLASGSVTVGSTAATWTLVVPALSVLDDPGLPVPIEFNTALTVAATKTDGSSALTTGLLTDLFYR